MFRPVRGVARHSHTPCEQDQMGRNLGPQGCQHGQLLSLLPGHGLTYMRP